MTYKPTLKKTNRSVRVPENSVQYNWASWLFIKTKIDRNSMLGDLATLWFLY
jgi:hypothetical protein